MIILVNILVGVASFILYGIVTDALEAYLGFWKGWLTMLSFLAVWAVWTKIIENWLF